MRTIITNEIWLKLKKALPKRRGRRGNDDRNFLEAVAWIARTGAPWRDLPRDFGSWKTVYNRYNRWSKLGFLEKVLDFFKRRGGQ